MNVNDRYLEAKVMSASPVELVRMLYRRAIGAVAAARRHLAEGDIRARSQEISRAMEIAVELAGSLDRENGGEVARQLASLYDYMERRLIEANLHQDDRALAEVEGLLATLDEAWAAMVEPASAPASLPAAAPEDLPAAYGYPAQPAYAPGAHCWSA